MTDRFDAWRAVWPAWAVTRFGVLLVGYMAVLTIGFPGPPPWTISGSPLLNLAARWDTGWYLPIAQHGYTWPPTAPGGQSEIVFFPLYPLLMRLVGIPLGGRVALAGWVVSMGACLWGLVYFYRLARLHLDAERAGTAVLLLAAYPFAVYYSAIYTESLFLLCVVAAVFHACRRQPLATALWGFLAGLTRPTGVVLTVALALIALTPLLVRRFSWTSAWLLGSAPPASGGGPIPSGGQPDPSRGERITSGGGPPCPPFSPALAAASLCPALGLAAYSAYISFLTGDPLRWSAMQVAWNANAGPLAFVNTLRAIYSLGFERWAARPIDAMNELAVVFLVIALWPVLRRFGLPYAAFAALTIVPALMSGGVRSLGRYTAPMFPLFLWLAAAVPARHRGLWVLAFALLQAFVAILFFTWRPMM